LKKNDIAIEGGAVISEGEGCSRGRRMLWWNGGVAIEETWWLANGKVAVEDRSPR